VLVDSSFPYSEPRIVVTNLMLGTWPHVEPGGLLCLKETLVGACPGERILQAIAHADELLMFDAKQVDSDFRLEFSSYWSQKASKDTILMYSLVSITQSAKKITYAKSLSGKVYYFADSKKQLQKWLENRHVIFSGYYFGETKLQWILHPLIPSEFPQNGSDALHLLDGETLAINANQEGSIPLLLGASTASGDVVVGMLLKPSRMAVSTRGFRENSRYWKRRFKDSILKECIERYSVERVDGEYVHTRGIGGEYSSLKNKRVAIVGCGSLGSSICMLLAQAGVGSFLLVDNDHLHSYNTSRHVLGSHFLGMDKVDGMKMKIQEDFPHIDVDKPICERVEKMSDDELEILFACDLIVTCGIDFVGVKRIMGLRTKLRTVPSITCWAEPFSLSGHSFAILASDNLDMAIGENCRSSVELVDWSSVEVMAVEAGCGNYFQPYGAIDLQRIAVMSARHALDVLQLITLKSEHRTWLGDKQVIKNKGGKLMVDACRKSNSEESEPWPIKRG